MIKGSTRRVGDRVSIRSVLRGADAPRRGTRRRTKALVGWLLYCCTAIGGTAAAWTVRETLFPSLGAPTTRSVWEHPSLSAPSTTEQSTTSTEARPIVITKALVANSVATTQSSIDQQTVPSASSTGAPDNSVNSQGTGSGGPGTSVVDDPTDTSVPHSGPTTSVDPTSSTSNPGPSTSDSDGDSDGDSSGKGSGGNSGGDGENSGSGRYGDQPAP